MRVLFIFLVTSQIVYGCGYDDFTAPGKTAEPDIIPNTDIGYVRFLCGNGSGIVADDIVVGGYVTANDKSGNIYRSFFIEDGTGALEVRAGMYSLHNVYVRGRYVAVKLSGLTVSIYNGTLQAGLSVGENGVGAGYIDNWAVAADYLHTWSDYGNLEPLSIRVPEFSEESCGRLIRLEGMKFIPAEENQLEEEVSVTREGYFSGTGTTWAVPVSDINPVPQAAYRYFEDRSGNGISVYTSGYANFAGSMVPVGRVSLTGILSYNSAGYNLKLRDLDDVEIEVDN